MRIRNTDVVLVGESNFVIRQVNSHISTDAKRITVRTDPKTCLLVAKNFFAKVFGVNRNYPAIFGTANRNIVEVRRPTLEIWVERALVACVVYNLLRKEGIL